MVMLLCHRCIYTYRYAMRTCVILDMYGVRPDTLVDRRVSFLAAVSVPFGEMSRDVMESL